MPNSLREPDMGDASWGRTGRGLDLSGTTFTDSKGNSFYYDDGGKPKYVGLNINGRPPQPASVPNVRPLPATGLPGPGQEFGHSDQGLSSGANTASDYPMSYNIGTGDYQAAARKAFDDYLYASANRDSQGMARALREREANPPDYIKAESGPQMGAYDPAAEDLKRQRFQDGMLGAVSLPAAWSGGLATMLGKDEATRSRWMEGGAEIGAALSPIVAEARGLMGIPAARDALKPVGALDNINHKGAVMEGAAALSAYQRGAAKVFDGKYDGDKGFDGAYILRDDSGYPQLHIDSVKARNGAVPVYGKGSMTELGTNNTSARSKAENALRKNIDKTPIGADFTDDDKETILDQLDRGDLVVNLIGLPNTGFHQGHLDFIGSNTPYTFGSVRKIDPFSPSKAPLLDGAPYGLSSVYLAKPDPSLEKH